MKLNTHKNILEEITPKIIDPLARKLAENINWWSIDNSLISPPKDNLTNAEKDLYPIAILGEGKPTLLLHGFDSSFLEFRRLAEFLKDDHQLFIPDLFGFGFCPRPINCKFNIKTIIRHLNQILRRVPTQSPIGVIGASMGGAIAMELARQNQNRINRLLLLSPAGLTGTSLPIPHPLNQIGVWFLSRKQVRKQLCRQAFANPKESVGEQEEQIASLHLSVPGWHRALADFAQSGGVANCGNPLPNQPLKVIWGENDRILQGNQKLEALELLGNTVEKLDDCGHLPHLDQPELVANRWRKDFQ